MSSCAHNTAALTSQPFCSLQWVANETGYTLGTADARLLPMHHGDSFVVVADVTSVRHWPGEIWRRVEADIVNAAVVMRNRVTSCKRTKR